METRERFLALCFFHNAFAARKFDPELWIGDHIVHMTLEAKTTGRFQDWIRLTP